SASSTTACVRGSVRPISGWRWMRRRSWIASSRSARASERISAGFISVLRLVHQHAAIGDAYLHFGRGQAEVVDGLVEKLVQLVARVVIHRGLVDEQDVGDHPAMLHPEPLRLAAGCAAACAADSTIVACNLNADEGPRSERWLSASKANGLLENEEAVRLSLV